MTPLIFPFNLNSTLTCSKTWIIYSKSAMVKSVNMKHTKVTVLIQIRERKEWRKVENFHTNLPAQSHFVSLHPVSIKSHFVTSGWIFGQYSCYLNQKFGSQQIQMLQNKFPTCSSSLILAYISRLYLNTNMKHIYEIYLEYTAKAQRSGKSKDT